ncbi:hypothetical protein NDU88_003616 [Pleurodeles waltl]|uniref:Uncharacterized protein n=1 Tax=Pleurodeles waltl TaxID=8319 RepID=A0AAV7QFZ1_PLEWA|nr:hypothetical protein NDU88_003616 [Pleurodeles waltl]
MCRPSPDSHLGHPQRRPARRAKKGQAEVQTVAKADAGRNALAIGRSDLGIRGRPSRSLRFPSGSGRPPSLAPIEPGVDPSWSCQIS